MTYPVNIEEYIEEMRKTRNLDEKRVDLLRELLTTANLFYESGLRDCDCVGIDMPESSIAEFERSRERKMRPRARAFADLLEIEFRKAYDAGCATRTAQSVAAQPT